jgi:hypothetical protein
MNQATNKGSRQTIGRALGGAAAVLLFLPLSFTQRAPMPLMTGKDFMAAAADFTAAGPTLALGTPAAGSA